MKSVGLLLLASNLVLVGCAGAGKYPIRVVTPAGPRAPEAVAPVLKTLADTRWVVIELGGLPVAPSAEGWPSLSLEFDPAGTGLSGHGGINRFAGRYSQRAEALEFGPLALTRRAGPPAQMELEQAYTGALSRVAGWRQAGSHLALLDAEGGRLVLLRPATE